MNATDPSGRISRYGRDQFNRPRQTIDSLSGTSTYTYVRDRLASLTDANGNATSYAYDSTDRLTSTTFPDGGIERYSYTGDGLVYQETDRRNQVSTYSYDPHKRLSQRTYPGSASIQYIYTGQRLTQVVDSRISPTETHLFSYDSSYRVSSATQGARGTVNYQYNAADEPLTVSVQGGASTQYTYYGDGSLSTLTWSAGGGEVKYRYTLAGQYESISLPSGQTRNYSYDDQGRLLQLAHLHPSVGNLATYSYAYDLNHSTGTYDRLGQRVSMTATVPAQGLASSMTKYEFDVIGHLTKATYPSAAPFNGEIQSWTYDAIGNRTSHTTNGAAQSYAYQHVGANPNAWDRLLNDGQNTYTYDSNGNTLTRGGTNGDVTLAWNTENRIASISGGASATYGYDYAGRRARVASATPSTFLYDGQHIVSEQGTSTTAYLYGPGLDEALAIATGGQVYYYVGDGLGSISLLVDGSGAVLNSYIYDAWGNTRGQSGSIVNRLGYTGRETDVAGLLFYRARHYQPAVGRFASADPMLRSQKAWASELMYSYADSSPVLFTDPLGLYQKCQTYEHESFRLIDTEYYRTPWFPVDQFSPGAGSPSPLSGSSSSDPAGRRGGRNPRGMRPHGGSSGAGGAATSGAVFVQACLWQRVTTLSSLWEVTKWSQSCCWDTCEPGSTECTPPSKYVYGRTDEYRTTDHLTTKGWRAGPFFKVCDDPRQTGSGL
jgi:RHS repeat-associated protein